MSKKTKRVAAVAAGATAAAAAGVAVAKVIKSKKRRVIHVEPRDDRWQVMVEGNKAASKTFDTKEEALEAGRSMAHKRVPSELVIHRTDGSEQDRHSYQA